MSVNLYLWRLCCTNPYCCIHIAHWWVLLTHLPNKIRKINKSSHHRKFQPRITPSLPCFHTHSMQLNSVHSHSSLLKLQFQLLNQKRENHSECTSKLLYCLYEKKSINSIYRRVVIEKKKEEGSYRSIRYCPRTTKKIIVAFRSDKLRFIETPPSFNAT